MERIFHNQTDQNPNESSINDSIPNIFTVLHENDPLNKTYIDDEHNLAPFIGCYRNDNSYKDPEVCKNLNAILNNEVTENNMEK